MLKRYSKVTCYLILCFLVVAVSGCGDISGSRYSSDADAPPAAVTPAAETSFKFGVMGDTQWTYDLDDPLGENPETVAVSFINQMNQQFINHDVEFVIQVGDLTNYGYDAAIQARADAAQALYDAGIGFFPMRGNHEPWGDIFNTLDTDGDGVADTPEDNQQAIPAIQAAFPQTQGTGVNTGGATNFSSPTSDDPLYPDMATELAGISYAFEYDGGDGNSATFVIMDPWETDTVQDPIFTKYYAAWDFYVPYPYGYPISAQQAWISSRIDATTRGTEHAFVFSHQPLIASNHEDSPFGFLDEHTDDQNTFYADLVANDVAFYISGHDHLHDRSLVTSPDGLSTVEQLISAPSCPKFYAPNYDTPEWRDQKFRKEVISTEYNNPGYYIYTVSGPIVTCDYYADSTGGWVAGSRPNAWPAGAENETDLQTPTFNFVLKDTWRFSLNGQAFSVAQGDDYSIVSDNYSGTSVQLDGTNTSTSVECATCADATSNTMPLLKRITTGWKDQTAGVNSSILLLDGMNENGAATVAPYLLSMSTGSANVGTRIVAKDNDGNWVDASTLTQNGPSYVTGAGSDAYAAGTYGYDADLGTAWVVLDYDGTFAIKQYD